MKNTVGLTPPTHSFGIQHNALIIGAGLAGCAVANALAQRGYSCTIYDTHATIASATSSIPVACIRPASSGDELHTRYYTKAFKLCIDKLNSKLFTQCGALQLIKTGHDKNLPSDSKTIAAKAASSLAGTHIASDAWYSEQSGWIIPAALCEHWINHKSIEVTGRTTITSLRQTEFGWQLLSANTVVNESALVILANAASAKQFAQGSHLPLQQSGGQIDLFACEAPDLQKVIHSDNYLVPTPKGVWSGATFHRNQSTAAITAADSSANLNAANHIAPRLSLSTKPIQSFAGVRTATPDRLPVVGAMPDETSYRQLYRDLRHGRPADSYPEPVYLSGLYITSAFGSRGATQALLAAELLSDLIADSEVDTDFIQALHPARFLLNSIRRNQGLADS